MENSPNLPIDAASLAPSQTHAGMLENKAVQSMLAEILTSNARINAIKDNRNKSLLFFYKIKADDVSQTRHVVKLRDHLSMTNKPDVGIEITLSQQIDYEGQNLKLLLFLALLLINSQSFSQIFTDFGLKQSMKHSIRMGVFFMEYISFIEKNCVSLDIENQSVQDITSAWKSSLSTQQRTCLAMSPLFFKSTRHAVKRDCKHALEQMNNLDLTQLKEIKDLPHSIEEHGILSKDQVKIGFTGWS